MEHPNIWKFLIFFLKLICFFLKTVPPAQPAEFENIPQEDTLAEADPAQIPAGELVPITRKVYNKFLTQPMHNSGM